MILNFMASFFAEVIRLLIIKETLKPDFTNALTSEYEVLPAPITAISDFNENN